MVGGLSVAGGLQENGGVVWLVWCVFGMAYRYRTDTTRRNQTVGAAHPQHNRGGTPPAHAAESRHTRNTPAAPPRPIPGTPTTHPRHTRGREGGVYRLSQLGTSPLHTGAHPQHTCGRHGVHPWIPGTPAADSRHNRNTRAQHNGAHPRHPHTHPRHIPGTPRTTCPERKLRN